MPWTPPPLPTGLSDRLALIIESLRGVIAAHMVKDRSAVAIMFLAWARLGRLASRFEKLVAAVRAGWLPSALAPRDRAGRDFELPRLEGLPPPRLPGGFGWLIRLVPGTAAYGGQVQHLLADPEMAALLANVPQAGRILRPLYRMLGIRPGPELVATRRRRSASSAGSAASGEQPDASATRDVAISSPPGSGLKALPASPPWQAELPGPDDMEAAAGAPSLSRDGNLNGAGADPPLARPAPA
ncbi:MAG: hypothetical protein JOY71_13320 [Acetobacteraceae bacterium]|nr:hypothetical protein [Acetobacteraceae bacterium]MBV8523081.1 hypothetical protein [Acetobacteraceae bacterium]